MGNDTGAPLGLRDLRKFSGLTQTRAARVSGINHSRISMAETGEIELSAAEEAKLRRCLLALIRERAVKMQSLLASARRESEAAEISA
jgi:transcriptional regulator with XRE-family HTH domain